MQLKQFCNIATKISSRKKCYYFWWSTGLISAQIPSIYYNVSFENWDLHKGGGIDETSIERLYATLYRSYVAGTHLCTILQHFVSCSDYLLWYSSGWFQALEWIFFAVFAAVHQSLAFCLLVPFLEI